MKYVFAGGGTGGHIFPAIAIADEIRKKDTKAGILFIGAKGRIEEMIVPSNNYDLKVIDIKGFERKSVIKNIFMPFKILKAVMQSRKILEEFRPDAVIGTGGFVSGPVVLSAIRMKIPTLIQEGNSFAGITVKWLSGKADKVIINFSETEKYLKRKDNIVRLSHPIRSSLKISDKNSALESLGLDSEKKTIFIFGGSQGARGINSAVEKIIDELYDKRYNIIWQTGKSDFQSIKQKHDKYKSSIRIFEFIENIAEVYSASDLVICRAGITSIMEIAYFGIPAIFIPLPESAEDHQTRNAESLVNRKAAVLVRQDETEKRLFEEIELILNDGQLREEMRKNISKISDVKAGEKIAEEVIKLSADERKNL